MKRGGYIDRRTPLRRVRVRRKKRTVEEQQFMDWGHRQPCIVAEFSTTHLCSGAVECCHRDEGKGTGVKTPDMESIFVCWAAARDWDNNAGVFEGSKALRRQVHRLYSAVTLDRYWKAVADGGPF